MPIRSEWACRDQISSDQPQTLWLSSHHDDASLLGITCCHCSGSIRQFPDPFYCSYSFSIVQHIQTAALVCRLPYDTDSPLLTRSTYSSDHGPCAVVPVYKHPVFRQSSPKLDLIDNINVLESSPSASPFPTSYISHSELSLATLETSTPSKYLPPVHS